LIRIDGVTSTSSYFTARAKYHISTTVRERRSVARRLSSYYCGVNNVPRDSRPATVDLTSRVCWQFCDCCFGVVTLHIITLLFIIPRRLLSSSSSSDFIAVVSIAACIIMCTIFSRPTTFVFRLPGPRYRSRLCVRANCVSPVAPECCALQRANRT